MVEKPMGSVKTAMKETGKTTNQVKEMIGLTTEFIGSIKETATVTK